MGVKVLEKDEWEIKNKNGILPRVRTKEEEKRRRRNY